MQVAERRLFQRQRRVPREPLRRQVEQRIRTQRRRLRAPPQRIHSGHRRRRNKVVYLRIQIQRHSRIRPRRHLQVEHNLPACRAAQIQQPRRLRLLRHRLAQRHRVRNLPRARIAHRKDPHVRQRRSRMLKRHRIQHRARLPVPSARTRGCQRALILHILRPRHWRLVRRRRLPQQNPQQRGSSHRTPAESALFSVPRRFSQSF